MSPFTLLGILKRENVQSKEKVEKQEKEIESLTRETRKNLLIKGVEDKEDEKRVETMAKVVKIINAIGAEINSEKHIDESVRMGKYKPMSIRPIMMKMITGESKMDILRKANNLKGTNLGIDEVLQRKYKKKEEN
ncbi:hypothetical protein Zmor_011229 [Zophobas morio]|uniref:Uncharacterized protein n=1 Tax=Zophobas morio TaxID=2755281 RepID=A0AA38IPT7_9CUCU|nr:hypothetical protein Zmor_011229 [Zophobas morio]